MNPQQAHDICNKEINPTLKEIEDLKELFKKRKFQNKVEYDNSIELMKDHFNRNEWVIAFDYFNRIEELNKLFIKERDAIQLKIDLKKAKLKGILSSEKSELNRLDNI